MNEAEQDVLGPDVVVVEHAGLFLGQHDNTSGSVSKTFKHCGTLLATAYFRCYALINAYGPVFAVGVRVAGPGLNKWPDKA
ncbi:hypothetical protein GCM10027562_39760 [Arthrobacter pigmenti]